MEPLCSRLCKVPTRDRVNPMHSGKSYPTAGARPPRAGSSRREPGSCPPGTHRSRTLQQAGEGGQHLAHGVYRVPAGRSLLIKAGDEVSFRIRRLALLRRCRADEPFAQSDSRAALACPPADPESRPLPSPAWLQRLPSTRGATVRTCKASLFSAFKCVPGDPRRKAPLLPAFQNQIARFLPRASGISRISTQLISSQKAYSSWLRGDGDKRPFCVIAGYRYTCIGLKTCKIKYKIYIKKHPSFILLSRVNVIHLPMHKPYKRKMEIV